VYRLIIILSILWQVSSPKGLQAAHLVGGEMSYECVGNGDYLIRLKIYRDCNGSGAAFDDTISVAAFQNLAINGFPLISQTFLEHGPIVQLPNVLNNPCLQSPPNICTEYTVYEGVMFLPPVNGGYIVAHQRCCRNPTVSNVPNSGDWGNTFLVNIPSNDLACNSTPEFVLNPPVIMCLNDSLQFDHSALESDGDSLYYSLCDAFHGGTRNNPAPIPASTPPYQTIPFVAGLNAANPIPGNPAININPTTGYLSGRPTVQGQYLFTVCVEEFRNGQLMSTVRRDFQINVTSCQGNVVSEIVDQFQLITPSLCSGTTVEFENNSIGGQLYLWNFNDPGNPSATSTLREPIFTFSDTGTYDVRLIVNPGTPCADTTTSTFELHYPVEVDIEWGGSLCFDNQQIQLSAAGNFSNQADFLWTINGQTFNGQQISIPPFPTMGPYSIEIEVEDYGCVGNDSIGLSLFNRPVINGQIDPVQGCEPFTLFFEDSSSNDLYINHLWRFGDGQSSNQPTPTHTYNQAGVYSVEHIVWSDTACVDSVYRRYVNIVRVDQSPEARLLSDAQVASIYRPFFVLKDSSSADVVQSGTSMDDGTEYFNATIWTHAYTDTGTYKVTHWVINSSGCSDTAFLTLIVEPEFRLYIPSAFHPNGDGNNEEFRIMGSGWRKIEIYICDRWGGQVFKTTDASIAWNGRLQNTGNLLPEGVYSWRVLVWGTKGQFEERMGTLTLLR
jgi:gliding motility-associated-like protein